ncbi:MAG: primosomal protein DnaI [Candidatus Magnetoglobus multicellularis str. Araruama]|uniref:Primosomal protein DnaI n=1 Tax=Candidatus Magnetoglobus multicellularis str. Araruama TaxID=890399 RepID=A0A1V1P083_9BACT|nr:MAG: primosomal protein DnaI [Candidatus Magnetoglobus multicellularis str. Araruama]
MKIILHKRGFQTGKYRLMTFDRWDTNREDGMQVIKKAYDYINNTINGASNRNWLYMHGENGLGKTHMAIASARQIAINNLWEPCVVRWSEYCTLIQQSWHDRSLKPDWNFTRESRILVLDDIDKKPSTQWALGQLYEILDIRDINNLPTIITTNRSIGELSEFWSNNIDTKGLSRSIISRIMGQIFKVIYFKGEDYRFIS